MTRADRVRTLLEATFSPSYLEIIDESHLHAGHNAEAKLGGTHLRVIINSEALNGLPLVQRHRRVNVLLKEEFADGLHAFSVGFR